MCSTRVIGSILKQLKMSADGIDMERNFHSRFCFHQLFHGCIQSYGNPPALEVSLEISHELELLIKSQSRYNELQDIANSDVMFLNEAAVIHVGEYTHEESRPICQT